MNYEIKDFPTLKKLLWGDFILGSSTPILELLLFKQLSAILGLPVNLIVFISIITLLYSIVAFTLLMQKSISIPLLRTLVYANWVWAFVSIGLLVFHISNSTILGIVFLVLQIVVVGGLAYLEGRQIVRN